MTVDWAAEMRAVLEKMARDVSQSARDAVPSETGAIPAYKADQPTITIRKVSHTLPVSTESAVASGLITDDLARERGWTPPPPPVSRWRSIRWAWQSWWYEHKPHVHLGPCDHGDCM